MALIIDTSAILANFDEDMPGHGTIRTILAAAPGPLIVPPLVVTEADYMLCTRLGAGAAIDFIADVTEGAYELAEWTMDDHAAALGVIHRDGSHKDYIGIVDASIVVLADKYRTTRILTLDQRHFRRLRPLWGADWFTLLPFDA